MSDRGTQNSPNTRHPNRPASEPSKLDQFADNVYESAVEMAKELSAIRREDLENTEEKGKS